MPSTVSAGAARGCCLHCDIGVLDPSLKADGVGATRHYGSSFDRWHEGFGRCFYVFLQPCVQPSNA